MHIDLTEEQQRAVMNGEAVHLPSPELGGTIVLLRAEQYERLRELLEEEEEDRKMREAWLRASHEAAVSWMKKRIPTEMIQQGEIYLYSDPRIPPHPVVVVSREELNRGDRVVAAVITSAKFAVRSKLANCVPLKAGQFGMTKDCVVQGEFLFNAPTLHMDLATGPIGKLDDLTLRECIRAVGYVMDSDCEPN